MMINIVILSTVLFFANLQSSEVANKLVVFEGSDWCASCRKFESNVLQDSTVLEFMEKNYIEVLKVDFPQRKKLSREQEKLNELLAKKYDFKGVFPTVVFVPESRGKYYTLHSKETSARSLIEWLENHMQPEDD